ncbi:MAG: tetratricopeptide repeat protein [bacterium]
MKAKVIFYLILLYVLCSALHLHATSEDMTARESFELGITYYDEGNFSKAAYFFEKAIQNEPSLIEAYYNLGSTLESLNDINKAIAVYESIVERWPQEKEVLSRLAHLYSRIDNQNMADKYRLMEGHIGTHLGLHADGGESDPSIVLIKKELEEKAQELKKKLEESPSDVNAAIELGIIYRKLGYIDKSITELEKSLELNPGRGIIYMQLGISNYFKGDYDTFIINTKKARDLGYNASNSLDDLSKIMEIEQASKD